MNAGRVEVINIGPRYQLPDPVERVRADAGKGLVGNRYHFEDGAEPGRALTLIAAEAAAGGARLVLFPETFVPVYPSSRWARSLAVWGEGGKELWARLAREAVTVPSAETERIGAVAREHALVLAVGVNELAGGTLYNTLLVFNENGELALSHRKLMPTNH